MSPKVVLIGVTHTQSQYDQSGLVARILQRSLEERDVLLVEDDHIYEVLYGHYIRDDFVHELKPLLRSKGIRTIMNDDAALRKDWLVTAAQLTREANPTTVAAHNRAREARDMSFVHHSSVGILSIFNGTAKLHQAISDVNCVYQVIGRDHIVDGNITDALVAADVPYIALVPK